MTKLLPLLAAAFVATAGVASASSYFGFNEVQSSSNLIQLGTVVSSGAGVVEVYDYRTGQEGRLLGSRTVRAGANTDVKISLAPAYTRDVLAVLKVDGDVVAQQVVRVR
ncbi:hypothetical protein [Rubellimicrobium arenae]|uniref:hypothetical protein n=1 Tax=Rubellimicrobium arenae TaxID=2817372 RepID=UPI001B317464|nr:hypothetical protein [Rubellimicrobium arenae]